MTQTEPDYRYSLTGPEIEMIEVVRLAHMSNFELAVSHRDGVFTVTLTDIDGSRVVKADATTFETCWRTFAEDQQGLGLNLQDRVLARGTPTEVSR